MKSIRQSIVILLMCATLSATSGAKEKESCSDSIEEARSHRFDPVVQEIEGWTVHVDPQLLEGEHSENGARALKMLANHLQRIAILVPEEQLTKLRTIEFWVEYAHPQLGAKQYHPNLKWLTDRGHDPRLAKKIHITHADQLLSRQQMLKHPAVILHELAHAYHDQYLSFNHQRIIDAYERPARPHVKRDLAVCRPKAGAHAACGSRCRNPGCARRARYPPYVRTVIRRKIHRMLM